MRALALRLGTPALVLGLAACGGTQFPGGVTPYDSRNGSQSPDVHISAVDALRKSTVIIRHDAFAPVEVSIQVTDSVVWKNMDSRAHTITKVGGPGERFSSGRLAPGASYKHSFIEEGVVKYRLDDKSDPEGTITIVH